MQNQTIMPPLPEQPDGVRIAHIPGWPGYAVNGEKHGAAKLTELQVRQIRSEYIAGSRTHGNYALARKYRISAPVIKDILHRRSWRHI